MKRAKKNKPDVRRKFTLSEKQLAKKKAEITQEAITKISVLYLVYLAELGWDEEQIVDAFETVTNYGKYIDEKIVKAKEVQKIIEERTGIVILGKW